MDQHQNQDHDNGFELERLLSADAQALHQQTQARLQSGLKLRLTASLTSSPSFAPVRHWNVALAAAVIVVLIGVVATRVHRYLPSHSNVTPAIASASQTPQVQVASVLPQKVALSTARVRTRRTSIKVAKPVHHFAPFPSPSPLSPEEHALMQIARAQPQERLLIYTQQQQMTEDYLRGIQEFKAKIASQGDANER